MSAVNSDLAFVQYPGSTGCGCNPECQGSPYVFRSVWDRLIQQLFGVTPQAIDSETQLPNITIWREGVELVNDSYPYTFRITTADGGQPRPQDVVLYKGKYYVIGAVNE